jgi:diguanylate cyclase (GGDEF)-like protein
MKTTTPKKAKTAPVKERLAYLEEAYRHTLESLEMAASLGLPEGDPPPHTVGQVLRETSSRLRGLLRFKAHAFFLVREPGGDFHMARCHPPAMTARMEEEMRLLVESGSAAWALRHNRPVFTSPSVVASPSLTGTSSGTNGQLLLHSMATASRIRGMFLGLTTQDIKTITDASLALITIVLRSSASLLEGLELYGLLRETNAALTAKVRDLEESRRSLIREIERRRKVQETLKHQALHDALTGLPNRTLMLDRIRQAIHRARRHEDFHYAVAFMDLDRFKLVNDTLGHNAGDQLLVQVSRRLVESVRQLDTVARFGGDEFVIFLEDLSSSSEAFQVLNRILQSVALPFDIDGQTVEVTGSIGLAFGDQSAKTPDHLIKNADTAMQQAKDAGRNRIKEFDFRMRQEGAMESALLAELRRALVSGSRGRTERTGALYLPALSTEDLRLRGFAVIPVWTTNGGRVFRGEELVQLAARAGAGRELWCATLGKALGDLSAWRAESGAFADLAVSLGLAASQAFPASSATQAARRSRTAQAESLKLAGSATLVETVRSALEQTGLPGEALHLEISEDALESGGKALTTQLAELRELGVRFGVGGFGERLFTLPGGRPQVPEGLRGGLPGRPAADLAEGLPGDERTPLDLASLARALNIPVSPAFPGGAPGKAPGDALEGLTGSLAGDADLSRPLTGEEARKLVRAAGRTETSVPEASEAQPKEGEDD